MSVTAHNPIMSGFYPDPSICGVGEDFYLVNSTFAYFPGLPIMHSKDLAHWEQIGNACERISQLPLKGAGHSQGLFAPSIRYHDGTYYVICTNVTFGGNFIVTARDPAGPWSEPHYIRGAEGIDPSLFFDRDGKCYSLADLRGGGPSGGAIPGRSSAGGGKAPGRPGSGGGAIPGRPMPGGRPVPGYRPTGGKKK